MSPKQGSRRFNSIVKTKYVDDLGIVYLWVRPISTIKTVSDKVVKTVARIYPNVVCRALFLAIAPTAISQKGSATAQSFYKKEFPCFSNIGSGSVQVLWDEVAHHPHGGGYLYLPQVLWVDQPLEVAHHPHGGGYLYLSQVLWVDQPPEVAHHPHGGGPEDVVLCSGQSMVVHRTCK